MFLYILCKELGFACPRELLKHLTSKEITEWAAFFKILGDKRESEDTKSEVISKARGGL